MHSKIPDSHGEPATLARNGLGEIQRCACGMYSLHLQCVSIRLDTEAFEALVALVDASRAASRAATDARPLPVGAADGGCVH